VTLRELAHAVHVQRVHLTVTPDGGLRVRGAPAPGLRAALLEHKAEIVARLSTGDPILDMICDVFDCDLRRIERQRATPGMAPRIFPKVATDRVPGVRA